MSDSLRLGDEELRAIYERGFNTWSALHASAKEQAGLPLPSSHLNIQDAFRHHPSFPSNLHLDLDKYAKTSQIFATGCSAWTPNQPDSGCCELPPFHQDEKIAVASGKPILLKSGTSPIPEPGPDWTSWFAQPDKNYIAVLALAWSYILSARWTEIIPGTSLVYTSIIADTASRTDLPSESSASTLDIGDAGPAETRWWAAILAEGQGWQATLPRDSKPLCAPWSIKHQPASPFLIGRESAFQNGSAIAYGSASPPSCVEALRFLDRFCLDRNLADQSQAALAAVLLMPSYWTNRGLQLPAFAAGSQSSAPSIPEQRRSWADALAAVLLMPSHWITKGLQLAAFAAGLQSSAPTVPQQRRGWADNTEHLDRLMTLSCRTRGVESMLLSVFYDPAIECNAAAPWLQGSLSAIRLLTQKAPAILGRMLMDRQPNLAPLWTGATILGLQDEILKNAWRGMITLDLLSAASSETMQSFVQEPVSDPLIVNGNVSRADQCRLLFLSRKEFNKRLPICLWTPFGENPAQDTDLEVQAHGQCRGHRLRYQGFTWDCADGTTLYQPFTGGDPVPSTQCISHPNQVPVDYTGLDPDREHWSENSTRNIFGWLRFDGYAPGEQDIWKHEWFEPEDSDEEEEDEESKDSAGNTSKSYVHVETWLSSVAPGEYLGTCILARSS